MKEHFEDLQYLFDELRSLLTKYRFDFPEDIYKIFYDLLLHSCTTLKEMEVLYNEQQELICSRDNSNNRL